MCRGSGKQQTVPSSDDGTVGGQGRNRTADTQIFSLLLYQLSYLTVRRPQGQPLERTIYGAAPRKATFHHLEEEPADKRTGDRRRHPRPRGLRKSHRPLR